MSFPFEVHSNKGLYLNCLAIEVIRTIPPLANRILRGGYQQRMPADHIQTNDPAIPRDDGVQFDLALNTRDDRYFGINRFHAIDELRF